MILTEQLMVVHQIQSNNLNIGDPDIDMLRYGIIDTRKEEVKREYSSLAMEFNIRTKYHDLVHPIWTYIQRELNND